MNIFTDALFLYVFIFIILYFKVINLESDNYIKHKLYLFLAVTGFIYLVQIIKKIKSRCRVDPKNLAFESIKLGTLATLGYSIYTDLVHMNWSSEYMASIEEMNKKYLVVALIMITFIVIYQLVEMMFYVPTDECTKLEML